MASFFLPVSKKHHLWKSDKTEAIYSEKGKSGNVM